MQHEYVEHSHLDADFQKLAKLACNNQTWHDGCKLSTEDTSISEIKKQLRRLNNADLTHKIVELHTEFEHFSKKYSNKSELSLKLSDFVHKIIETIESALSALGVEKVSQPKLSL